MLSVTVLWRLQVAEAAATAAVLRYSLALPPGGGRFPFARRCFEELRRVVFLTLEAEGLNFAPCTADENNAGFSAAVTVNAPAANVEKISRQIAASHPLGKLFRLEPGTPAAPTAISPKVAQNLVRCFFRNRIRELVTETAFRALMSEAAVTPKPGLVDMANSGAHPDMIFFTFIDSASAIVGFFGECAAAGFDSAGGRRDPSLLFESLRPPGKIAERLMLRATGGVNTHKGVIFSLALAAAACGILYRKEAAAEPEEILNLCKAMTVRLPDDFENRRSRPGSSHGETVFAAYGIRGIRGEAAAGFPSVKNHSLPVLRGALEHGHSLNDAGVAALLSLIAHVDDTNIIHRSDLSTLRRVQSETALFLERNPPMPAIIARAAEMDRQFTAANISPGGCADLLALTFFLHFVDKSLNE